ncbi:CRISPR-associated endonuclease/helicase Cas3 [Halomonas cerina]|uniref:CRISPR-associated endonuclease/helicase Cas3 n=1 Tax=Halomonas cerina TaxID=447424 RepID=A0A839VEM0_9GAMM|nr:CRISPR-associated endonuclease/helicase Cas3 [Halomonas cerina]
MAFQGRLKSKGPVLPNQYRHEWVSLRLFEAFVGNDDDAGWLTRMTWVDGSESPWLTCLQRDGLDSTRPYPLRHLPPVAQAVAWLILTHHRLPVMPGETPGVVGGRRKNLSSLRLEPLPQSITAQWNSRATTSDRESVVDYWTMKGPLPVCSLTWQRLASDTAWELLACLQEVRGGQPSWHRDPFILHLSRLSLVLSDHHYSSLKPGDPHYLRGDKGYQLGANTDRQTRKIKQSLDAHLIGVGTHAERIAGLLPEFVSSLPRLKSQECLGTNTQHERFQWQNDAHALAASLQPDSISAGFFGINMASTGTGKTVANARILYGLSDPKKGSRITIGLGLRTLTLQTGRALRDVLKLDDQKLAVRVGGSASRALLESFEKVAQETGSSSIQDLFSDASEVIHEGALFDHPIRDYLDRDSNIQSFLAAPLLVCTVDHLMPATECLRGGRQIPPMLRLMGSDLILDELDNFDLADLPALTRLVNWAGMLGSRVLVSSATLPPSLVSGLFDAYREGRALYRRHALGEPRKKEVCCAWFDEYESYQAPSGDLESFQSQHLAFASRRASRLREAAPKRRARLAPLRHTAGAEHVLYTEVAARIREEALTLHEHHHITEPTNGKRLSFGLVRMANINPQVDVALALYRLGAPKGVRIHLCTYHSQYPLLMRSAIERTLDSVLDRTAGEQAPLSNHAVSQAIEADEAQDHLFIVLSSPVAELGRDHDYDWAIAEPSSMRSLIQLAGRVMRHRHTPCTIPNMVILTSNLRAIRRPGQPAFRFPGYESEGHRLVSHDLREILEADQWRVIDAQPRIVPRDTLSPTTNLVDLEHFRLDRLMVRDATELAQAETSDTQETSETLTPRQRRKNQQDRQPPHLGAYSWYVQPQAQLTGVLTQAQPFREDTQSYEEVYLKPTEEDDDYALYRIVADRQAPQREALYDERLHHLDLDGSMGKGISPWVVHDYLETLGELAEELRLSSQDCAWRFGRISLPELGNGERWRFHPALGFSKASKE